MAGQTPNSDDEASYHRHLTRTINARYGEALKVWEERIVQYVGTRDEETIGLAKQLDKLQRRGVDAELALSVALARKPLPVDRPTAALAYRIKALNGTTRRAPESADTFARRTQQPSGPAMGL
nr:hypothetical protein [Nocardioides sp. B-3]